MEIKAIARPQTPPPAREGKRGVGSGDETIAQTAAKELGYCQLKPEQADVIEAFVKGRVRGTANWLWQKPLLRLSPACV